MIFEEIAYGVDHHTSSFVTVITDKFIVDVNNLGVSISTEDDEDENPKQWLPSCAVLVLSDLEARFEYAREMGNYYPHLSPEDIFLVLRAFGAKETQAAIFANLDSLGRISVTLPENNHEKESRV